MMRRIVLLVAALVLLGLGGTFAITVGLARTTLQAQWQGRNDEAAALMAAALSQAQGDAATARSMLQALLARGGFVRVRYADAGGDIVFEHEAALVLRRVPAWLPAVLPLAPATGTAVAGDRDRAFGRVEVDTDPAWAYEALWSTAMLATTWLALLGAAMLLVAAWATHGWRAAVARVVAQADAMEAGRYVEIAEPAAMPELQHVAAGMNATVRRMHMLFDTQSSQLDELRRQTQEDSVTGLANRRHFMVRLTRALGEGASRAARADAPRRGALLIVRLNRLDAMNARIGHDGVDRLLASVGEVLQAYPGRVQGAVAGRLNGSDLALYLPVNGVAAETADALATTLRVGLTAVDAAAELAIGAVEGLPAGAASQALARADEALARAEAGGPFAVHVADGGAGAATGEREWRQRILGALDRGRARLGEFPLVDASGALVHLECPLRVQLQDGGPYEAAALWLPMASRGRLTQRVDRTAAELALRAIEADGRPRCVHVASASLADPAFVREIERLLAAAGRAARSLSLELGPLAPADAQRLRGAAALWRPHGVTLGIENAGDSLRQLLDVHAFGLDYLKVDARFVHGLARDATLAEYARQVAASARAIGVKAYASGIAEAADLARLWELGFDGATGPGVAA